MRLLLKQPDDDDDQAPHSWYQWYTHVLLTAIIDFNVKGNVEAILPHLLAWDIIPNDNAIMQRAAKKHIKWPSFEEVRKFRWGDWSHDIAMGKLTLPQKVSIQQGSFGSGYDTIVDLVWRDAEGVANHLMDKKHTRHYYRWHSEVVKELKYYRKYLRAVMGYWGQQKESGAMFVQTVTLARRYVSLVELVDQTERCVSIAHIGVIRQNKEDEEERQDNKQRKKEERKSKNGNKRKSEFSKYCEEDPEPVKRQKTVVSVEIPPVSPVSWLNSTNCRQTCLRTTMMVMMTLGMISESPLNRSACALSRHFSCSSSYVCSAPNGST